MAQAESPDVPRSDIQLVDPRTGRLTNGGALFLDQMWRQIAAGFVVVPCRSVTTGTDDEIITLTPTMHKEGGRIYADHEVYAAVADKTVDGLVTARVGSLAFLKVYKDGGATQANVGDILVGRLYLYIYVSALDAGAGGLVLK